MEISSGAGDDVLTLKNKKELEDLLSANRIDASQWGSGESKQLHDLWNEIAAGESQLQTSPFQRLVQVVMVIIRREDLILVEVEQEFVDGRRRKRGGPPTDKMKPGEDIQAAAVRCLTEELQLAPQQIELLPDSYHRATIAKDSPSYPGLASIFTYHSIEARVISLPEAGFWLENLAEGEDPIRRHYWQWSRPLLSNLRPKIIGHSNTGESPPTETD